MLLLLSISIMGGLAAIAVLICKAALGRLLSPKAHLYIWLPVIARLLLPYVPPSTFSVYNHMPETVTDYIPVNTVFTPLNTTTQAIEINWQFTIWIAGVLLTLLACALSYIHFLRTLKTVKTCEIDFTDISEKAAEICGIKHIPQIIICQNNISPMIIGFWKRKLLLPVGIVKNFNNEQLLMIFLHEYTHINRKDYSINLLLLLVNAVHWFNPVVWIMARTIKRDCENICDETVLKLLSSENQFLYSKTIIDLVEYSRFSTHGFIVSPMASTKRTIKGRIKTIYSFSKKKLSVIALPVCIMISVTLLTGAMAKDIQNTVEIVTEKIPEKGIIPPAPTPDDLSGTSVHSNSTDVQNNTAEPTSTPKPMATPIPSSVTAVETAPSISADAEQTEIPASPKTTTPTSTPTANTQNQQAAKAYTYISNSAKGTATAKFSTDREKASFTLSGGTVEIRSVGISNSSENKISGYFSITENGKLVAENVKGSVDGSISGIGFSTMDGEYRYSLPLSQKTVE